MNFVTTRHNSNKFCSALAAPKFSDLFEYLDILSILISFINKSELL